MMKLIELKSTLVMKVNNQCLQFPYAMHIQFHLSARYNPVIFARTESQIKYYNHTVAIKISIGNF